MPVRKYSTCNNNNNNTHTHTAKKKKNYHPKSSVYLYFVLLLFTTPSFSLDLIIFQFVGGHTSQTALASIKPSGI